MGKVWIRMRYDRDLASNIPHNIDFASAMYGFREMAAEIVPYHNLSEIVERVSQEDIVVDYLDQCKFIFRKFGVNPDLPDYPEILSKFLGRRIWKDTIDSIANDESKWSAGYFVKPLREKAFTGKVIKSTQDLIGCGNYSENYEVFVSEQIDILAEWRIYVLYDEIVGIFPYTPTLEGKDTTYKYYFDPIVVGNLMETFSRWENRPTACSIDICLTRDKRTLMLEMNDAYALGNYGLHHILYAKMISARWSQLLGREDEYHF